ncbi:DUF2189 domain-containing protein [Qipengyuania nanhaisediminis]|uniref:Uncharacterized membrane protein n=1 Tax=Qipengyuania nanhaisediminis TaxID=604088 RepID=A0A1I5NSR1_9SPHN|nr:DUF2189 domain-containing protein [Qipengyuania nanhaisediminis]SFP24812.1 Uncharacterized membrane protein [Qipengyuania nanhaisediminis]
MDAAGEVQIAPVRVASNLSLTDLGKALKAGLADFLACPIYGLFFAAIYVAAGLFLYVAAVEWGEAMWFVPAVAGFPLVAPFTAVGLYEVSRRREAGLPVKWGAVLGAVRGKGDEQLIMMGGIVFVAFSFWMIIAHGIFAIFMAESGVGAESVEAFLTPAGLAMLAVGTAVGAIMALAFYAVTVVSLPMLVDREVDFLTAIITSLAAFRSNKLMLTLWAAIIALSLLVALVPAFLGLLVALPIFGHATWHIYRRIVRDAA